MTNDRRVGRGAVFLIAMALAASAVAGGRESGIQLTPDGERILVSKDVGAERYAITANTADRSLTGNVFFTDGGPAKFIACSRISGNDFSCGVADACVTSGRESGIQLAPDGGVLVSKDVNGQRFAITANTDGTLTGNVFTSATGGAQFLFCEPIGPDTYTCAVADSCRTASCISEFTTLDGAIALPSDFFTVPAECPPYQTVGGVIGLPASFFDPTAEQLSAREQDVFGAVGKTRQVTSLLALGLDAAAAGVAGTDTEPVACPNGGTTALVDGAIVYDACRVRDTICSGNAALDGGHLIPELACRDIERDQPFQLDGDVVQVSGSSGAAISGVAAGMQEGTALFTFGYDALALDEDAFGGRASGRIDVAGAFFTGFFTNVDMFFPGENPETDELDEGFARIVATAPAAGPIIPIFVFSLNLQTGKLTAR